jgi:predicted CoA-binding protein
MTKPAVLERAVVEPRVATELLAQRRLAIVGASDDPKSITRPITEALRAHGTTVVPVNPAHPTVGGETCYPSVTDIPEPVDGVIVATNREHAAGVVRSCIAAGVRRIWLFQGIGEGSVSTEAVELCRANGVTVVEGACPLMFLEPMGWAHRVHRAVRRHRGAIAVTDAARAPTTA